MASLLDANVFIQARRLHYGFDFPRVSTWVSGRPYSQAAANTFFQVADYYLVGRVLAHGDIVVTHEISEPLSKKNVKIPDVCIGLGIKCMTPYEMLRKERARFVLGS